MSVPFWTRQETLTPESWRENPAYDRSMNGFGAIEWLARMGFLVKGVVAYGFYEIIHARYLHIRRVRADGPMMSAGNASVR